MEQQKRLFRSRYDTVIGGVSGGLAKYFNTDPILIRVLFVVLTLFAAGGLIAYIILWIVMPIEPDEYYYRKKNIENSPQMENKETSTSGEKKDYPTYPDYKKNKNEGSLIAGIILITLGGMFLVDRFIPRIDFGDLWPILLIVMGVIIIFSNSRLKK